MIKKDWDNFLETLFSKTINLLPSERNNQNQKIKKYFSRFLKNYQKPKLIISVTGTNGKGSVCHFIKQILKNKYLKIGTFCSPHIITFEERIQINDVNIKSEEFLEIYHQHIDFIQKANLGFFQIIFLVAIFYFFNNSIDLLILEYGIGAKHDCCNVIDNNISVITSIDIDHQNWLGTSKEEVLKNKQAIARKNTTLICNLQQNGKLFFQLQKYLKTINVKLININDVIKVLKEDEEHLYFTVFDQNYSIKSKVFYQIINLSIAITVARELKIASEDIKKSLKNLTFLPGRCERFDLKNKTIILDGAHNLEGSRFFLEYLEKNNFIYDSVIFLGLLKDKDHEKILKIYLRSFDVKNIYLVYFGKNSNTRFLDKDDIENLKLEYKIQDINFYKILYSLKNITYNYICVTGSLLFISCFRKELLIFLNKTEEKK